MKTAHNFDRSVKRDGKFAGKKLIALFEIVITVPLVFWRRFEMQIIEKIARLNPSWTRYDILFLELEYRRSMGMRDRICDLNESHWNGSRRGRDNWFMNGPSTLFISVLRAIRKKCMLILISKRERSDHRERFWAGKWETGDVQHFEGIAKFEMSAIRGIAMLAKNSLQS